MKYNNWNIKYDVLYFLERLDAFEAEACIITSGLNHGALQESSSSAQ